MADLLWGVAAGVWILSGLTRAFGGLEKGSAFYLNSPLFWLKMGLLVAILLLEIWPMLTFMAWRRIRARGESPDTSRVATLYTVNQIQVVLVILMVFVASGMARGLGMT